jgi:uncharacterized protein with GYD domain
MATYVSLVKFTERNTDDLKGMPGRVRDLRERVASRGGRVVSWYLTTGQYDAVVIVESPDDLTALAGLLFTAKLGYVRTETMRAFTMEEVEPLVAQMG